MRPGGRLARWALLCALGAAACGGKAKGVPMDAGGGGIGGGTGGIGGAGGADGGLAACLDTPGAIPRPPSGRLPCELIPPGVQL